MFLNSKKWQPVHCSESLTKGGEDFFTSSSDTLQDAHILGVIDFKMHIYWQIGSNRKLHPDGQNTVQAVLAKAGVYKSNPSFYSFPTLFLLLSVQQCSITQRDCWAVNYILLQ